MDLLLMLQGVSWTHMTLYVELIIVMFADFNRKSNILCSYYIYLQYFNLYHLHVSGNQRNKISNLLSFLCCIVLCLNCCTMYHLMHFYFLVILLVMILVFIVIFYGNPLPLPPYTCTQIILYSSTVK